MSALEVAADAYHRDEVADVPTLSASVAAVLIERSPAHAYAIHPKLNPHFEQPDDEDKFDTGTLCHSLILQGDDVADVLHYDNWRTNAAKEARDISRAHGRIPILAKDNERIRRMVDAVRAQLERRVPAPFTNGAPEVTLVWDDRRVTCRGRLDWLTTDCARIWDLKTTSRSASPFRWGRTIYDTGADLQMAAYRRAVRTLYGTEPEYRWVVCETQPPFAVHVFRPGADLIDFADVRWEHALDLWRRCLETNEWPSYGENETEVNVPGYTMAAWVEREQAE